MPPLDADPRNTENNELSQTTPENQIFVFVQDIFYSRKNFERPELQLKPYRSFKHEVATLDQIFSDGNAFCMGSLNQLSLFIFWLIIQYGFHLFKEWSICT